MKKRLFAILLALTLALSLLPVAVFADGEDAAASNAQQEQQRNPSFQHLSFPSHRSFLCVNLRRSAAKSPTISPCPRRMYL